MLNTSSEAGFNTWTSEPATEQKIETHSVPYTIKNLTSTTIWLSFTLDKDLYQLVLHQRINKNKIEVFVIGADNSPQRDLHFQNEVEFQGRDTNKSYSVFMNKGEVTIGVIIYRESYLSLKGQYHGILKIEKHKGTIDDVSKLLQTKSVKGKKHRSKKKRSANNRKGKRVKVAIFTEHLLFLKYCELYSAGDPSCLRGQQELTKYAITISTGAKLYYDRIDNPDLKLQVQLTEVIHNARETDPYTNSNKSLFYGLETEVINHLGEKEIHVDAANALQRFAFFQNDYEKRRNKTYDQATLITLHGLGNDNTPGLTTIGIAYVQGVCEGQYKAAICQYKPAEYGYNTVQILAHEIGHNLGATHDGDYQECPESSNYIMSSHNQKSNLFNLHYFSCCSLIEIADTVYGDTGWCLDDWKEEQKLEEFIEHMPGVVYDRSKQCSAEFGDSYLPCHAADYDPVNGTLKEYKASFQKYVSERNDYIGSNGCLWHWCYDPDKLECETSNNNPILSGTWCDVDKWCIEGNCIPNATLAFGPHKPNCNITTQSLTVENGGENADEVGVEADKSVIYDIGDLLGRFAGLLVGAAFFIVGLISSVLRQRNRRSRYPDQTMHSSYGNAQEQQQANMAANVPPQYLVKSSDKE